MNCKPEPGSLWRFNKGGGPHRVLMLANEHGGDDADRFPVLVITQNTKLGHVWAIRLDQWHNAFSPAAPSSAPGCGNDCAVCGARQVPLLRGVDT